MTLVANPYTTETRIQRLFSSQGVTAFADHDQSGTSDTGVVDDCINRATAEIRARLVRFYEDTDLAGHELINEWATVLATFFLCQRRGNPSPDCFVEDVAYIRGELKELVSLREILSDIPFRGGSPCTVSNLTVDRRYRQSQIRVTEQNSSDAPTLMTQDSAAEVPSVFN